MKMSRKYRAAFLVVCYCKKEFKRLTELLLEVELINE